MPQKELSQYLASLCWVALFYPHVQNQNPLAMASAVVAVVAVAHAQAVAKVHAQVVAMVVQDHVLVRDVRICNMITRKAIMFSQRNILHCF